MAIIESEKIPKKTKKQMNMEDDKGNKIHMMIAEIWLINIDQMDLMTDIKI